MVATKRKIILAKVSPFCIAYFLKNIFFFSFVSHLLIIFSWSVLSHMLFHWRTADCSWLALSSQLKYVFSWVSACLAVCFLIHLKLFLQKYSTDSVCWKIIKDQHLWKEVFQPNKKLDALFHWWLPSDGFLVYSFTLLWTAIIHLMSESLPASFPFCSRENQQSEIKQKMFHFTLIVPALRRELSVGQSDTLLWRPVEPDKENTSGKKMVPVNLLLHKSLQEKAREAANLA